MSGVPVMLLLMLKPEVLLLAPAALLLPRSQRARQVANSRFTEASSARSLLHYKQQEQQQQQQRHTVATQCSVGNPHRRVTALSQQCDIGTAVQIGKRLQRF